MTFIQIPEGDARRLVFYLAMEEWLASKGESCFFVWKTRPTVIFGRNQDMEAEVDLDYCRSEGIEVYRRKSGGGCVYSDGGNLMMSYIVPKTGVSAVFDEFLTRLAGVLRSLGAEAVVTSHNDILVNGKKVSGNAFFALKDASIVHGTLLLNSDFDRLSKAITPSAEKLESHGVKSVRQRVGNLTQMTGISEEVVVDALEAEFCTGSRSLSKEEIDAIGQIEETYLNPSFLIGKQR